MQELNCSFHIQTRKVMDRSERKRERDWLKELLGCECNVPIILEEKEVCKRKHIIEEFVSIYSTVQ